MKFVLGIIFGALVVIFVVQNLAVVEVTFIAWPFTISRAIIFPALFVVGGFIGWVVEGGVAGVWYDVNAIGGYAVLHQEVAGGGGLGEDHGQLGMGAAVDRVDARA